MSKVLFLKMQGQRKALRVVLSAADAERYVQTQTCNHAYLRRQMKRSDERPTHCFNDGRLVPLSKASWWSIL